MTGVNSKTLQILGLTQNIFAVATELSTQKNQWPGVTPHHMTNKLNLWTDFSQSQVQILRYLPSLMDAKRCFDYCTWDCLKTCSWYITFMSASSFIRQHTEDHFPEGETLWKHGKHIADPFKARPLVLCVSWPKHKSDTLNWVHSRKMWSLCLTYIIYVCLNVKPSTSYFSGSTVNMELYIAENSSAVQRLCSYDFNYCQTPN